jgi:hypothetical protein
MNNYPISTESKHMRLCAFIYRGVLVSAPLQAFVFSSYLLNVSLQLANKNGIQNKKNNKKTKKK